MKSNELADYLNSIQQDMGKNIARGQEYQAAGDILKADGSLKEAMVEYDRAIKQHRSVVRACFQT